jgi:hypothetical protein
MRENISIYTRLRTVVTCTDRNVCNIPWGQRSLTSGQTLNKNALV